MVTLSATAMLVLKAIQAQGEQTSNMNQKNMTTNNNDLALGGKKNEKANRVRVAATATLQYACTRNPRNGDEEVAENQFSPSSPL